MRLFYAVAISQLLVLPAFADASITCGYSPTTSEFDCGAAIDPDSTTALQQSYDSCAHVKPPILGCGSPLMPFQNKCAAVYVAPDEKQFFTSTVNLQPQNTNEQITRAQIRARQIANKECRDAVHAACVHVATVCDRPGWIMLRQPTSTGLTEPDPPLPEQPRITLWVGPSAVQTAITSAAVLILVLLFYAQRVRIANFIIHARLPDKLPVYGEDIQCLFKFTQRVNWYGRVVFGIVSNLAMTHQQLIDVRKYWLGRVIAFDSLRRQRQNQLAKMHLQLAATVKTEAKEKKPLSQLLAGLKFISFVVFYLIRALFSFLFGFLFIRVTIAKLVRGTHIESKDLVLVLQAKEAVEESAKNLKEYIETANTFDGRDEVTDA